MISVDSQMNRYTGSSRNFFVVLSEMVFFNPIQIRTTPEFNFAYENIISLTRQLISNGTPSSKR